MLEGFGKSSHKDIQGWPFWRPFGLPNPSREAGSVTMPEICVLLSLLGACQGSLQGEDPPVMGGSGGPVGRITGGAERTSHACDPFGVGGYCAYIVPSQHQWSP